MVGLEGGPEQGGPAAYTENIRQARSAVPDRPEKTTIAGKNDLSETAVRNNGCFRRDRTVWTTSEDGEDWREQAVRLLEQLKKQYPGIELHLADGEEAKDLAALAVRAGTGMHLYLSREFVRCMGSSREEFGSCYSALLSAAGTLWAEKGQTMASGAFLGENGISYWSVPDKTDKGASSAVPVPGGEKKPSSSSGTGMHVSVSLNVSSHFSRVARARTKGQVQEAMWDIYRSISNLKTAAAYGDDQQRVKASRALRSLQKLLGRGGRKMRRLEQEKLKQRAQKKAEKEHRDRRAFRLKQEQKRMRSARLGADAGLVKEGHGDEYYIQAYRRFSGPGDKREYQTPEAIMAGLFDAMPSGDAGMAGASEAGFTAADVVVSGDAL